MPDHVSRVLQQWAVERPDLDVAPVGVIGRLHRLGAHLTDELVSVYRSFDLGEGEFDVLATLRRGGPLAPGELAENTMVTTGAMTKRIDRLVAAGFVTREPSESDGRGRVVALTATGTKLIDRAFEAHVANEHRLLAALDADEARQLETLLTKWLGSFEGR